MNTRTTIATARAQITNRQRQRRFVLALTIHCGGAFAAGIIAALFMAGY